MQETYGTDEVQDVGVQELAGKVVERSGRIPILPETVNASPGDIPGPPATHEASDWYPEDATANVWSTAANEPSEFLVAALHENGIHCRVDQQGAHAKLYVLPHDAFRAREIIREVVEGEPPE